jgi:hypothetical protein
LEVFSCLKILASADFPDFQTNFQAQVQGPVLERPVIAGRFIVLSRILSRMSRVF